MTPLEGEYPGGATSSLRATALYYSTLLQNAPLDAVPGGRSFFFADREPLLARAAISK